MVAKSFLPCATSLLMRPIRHPPTAWRRSEADDVAETSGSWTGSRGYISRMRLPVAIAQIRPLKGAYQDNLCRLGRMFHEAARWAEPPGLIVAPESALTGYFLEGGVRDLALPAEQLYHDLTKQHQAAGAPPFDIAIGFYEVYQNRLHNSALYATLGGQTAGIR